MFKKSRIKIIAAIMGIFLLVLVCTLSVIYLASYNDVYQTNQDMLDKYIQAYFINGNPNNRPPPGEPPEGERQFPLGPEYAEERTDASFWLSTFYSVAFSDDGEVLSVDNGINFSIPQSELADIARRLMQSGRQRGTSGNFVYRIDTAENYTLVAMMDNSILGDSITTLFRNTLVFGSVILLALLFFSVFLAGRIVNPLEQSYKRQKQFISDAGHELKTPIAVIRANAEMLEKEQGSSKWLSNIVYENERAAELVTQLLELARAESAEPILEELDFSRTVTGGALPFESTAFEHGVSLSLDIEEDLWVCGNAGQLGQLVSILLDNAILHAYPETSVTVSLRQDKNSAVLSVANAGDAIPPEQQEEIFERFYRADQARGGGRYGLGLAIAKAIVQGHKGKISVSCTDGVTEFSAVIPLRRT